MQTQAITHPTVSVWAVRTLPSGDIISGSSDSTIRIFTQSPARFASAEDINEFEASVASRKMNKTMVGDVKRSDLGGMDTLGQGKKEGEVKMVKNDGKVEAYQVSTRLITKLPA